MINVLSLFSGIGAFEKALENLHIPFNLVGYCEIDKYASKAYSLIHGVPETLNYGDITKIDEKSIPLPIDLITYGFPCQDISLAGKQKGLFEGNGNKTRSGLFFDALRIIEHTQPKIAIAENVKNLTSQKFNKQFNTVLQSLEAAGYNNYWKVLNSKDYKAPQNRERVLIVSIRKDIDTGIFEFPEPLSLELRLKDLLEDEVDKKYFVDPEKVKALLPQLKQKDVSNTLRVGGRGSTNQKHQWDMVAVKKTRGEGGAEIIQVGNICPTKTRSNPNQGRVYDPDGIAPTLNCKGGGNLEPFILIRANTKAGYEKAEDGDFVNLEYPNSSTRRGRVGKQVCQTLTTSPQSGG